MSSNLGFAEVAAWIELIVPSIAGGCALLEKQHYGLDPSTEECSAGAIKNSMQVAVLQKLFAQGFGSVIRVGKKGVLDHHRRPATGLEWFDEVLQKKKSRFTGLDREVLLNLLALLATEGGIGKDDVITVFLLNIGQVLRQGVGVDDIGRIDAVKDQVHDGNDIGQALLLLAVEGFGFQGVELAGG